MKHPALNFALLLTITLAVPALLLSSRSEPGLRVVMAQAHQQPSDPAPGHDQEGGSNKVVRKQDVDVYAAFILLQRLLPVGAHLGSGFRDKNDQIRVIRSYALKENIPVPPEGMTDANAWRPVAGALRARGYKIADPDKTPHSSDQKIVLDIGRADLHKIEEACERAAQKGWIKIWNLIYEPKQGIHVELNLLEKGMFELGLHQTLQNVHSSESETPQPSQSPPEDDERNKVMQELISLHESTPDPLKKIDYDKQRRDLFAKFYPFDQANLAKIEEEIKEHYAEAERNESDAKKQTLIRNVESAAEMGDLQGAESAAAVLAERFPEARASLDQMKIRRLLAGAIQALVQPDCDKCEEASKLVADALQISSGDERAQRIKGEVDICIGECKTRRIALILLGVFLVVGLAVGLFFSLRPRGWFLEGIDGQCKGQSFPLDKEKLVIGAVGSGDDESDGADIVISDPNHKISRIHCVLRQNGRSIYLKDKSSNGTKINAKEIEHDLYIKLRNWDEISLADEAVLLLKKGAKPQS